MNTSEVLNRAADLIELRGWMHGQGWNEGEDGRPLCLEGAIMAALGVTVDPFDEESFITLSEFELCPAYRAVQGYLGTDVQLYRWNDAFIGSTRRTAAEVIEVLRAAAVIEQAKEAAPVEVGAR